MTNNDPFKPTEARKRFLKIALYGDSGTGKTSFALSAPNPVVIDMEGGTQAYEGIYNFKVLQTQSYRELNNAIDFLLEGKHDYKTLVIDPGTVLNEAIQETRVAFNVRKSKKELSEGDAGSLTQRDWGNIKAIYKRIMLKLATLGNQMNVIMTFREKEKVDYTDPDHPKHLGLTFDGEKSSMYFFDINAQMTIGFDAKGNRQIIMRVIKARGFADVLDGKKILIPKQNGWDKIFEVIGEIIKKSEGDKPAPSLDTNAPERDADEMAPKGKPTDSGNASDADYRETTPSRAGMPVPDTQKKPAAPVPPPATKTQEPKPAPIPPPAPTAEIDVRKAAITRFESIVSAEYRPALMDRFIRAHDYNGKVSEMPDDLFIEMVEYCIEKFKNDEERISTKESFKIIKDILKFAKANSLNLVDRFNSFIVDHLLEADFLPEIPGTTPKSNWKYLDTAGMKLFFDYIQQPKKA